MIQNYESKYWGLIYDQMMEEHLSGWLENNQTYYKSKLRNISGPVLDCACGTGLILLPLLRQGVDVRGFDTSNSMLSTLRRKALEQGFSDIDDRISVQSLQSFGYSMPFDAVIIPTNSFVMLTTQQDQIGCLRNIHAHLAPGGRLLLDIRLEGIGTVDHRDGAISGSWKTWSHPDTGKAIRQKVDQVGRDLANQLTFDRCYIEYETDAEEFPMTARSVFLSEFQLLLRLAGFQRWAVWGGPNEEPLALSHDGTLSYWIAYRD